MPPEPGPNEPGNEPGPPDTRPFLCIPYWEAPRFPGDPVDIGQVRPLPAGVITWLCDGIQTSPFVPGQRLDVTVDIRNSGPGNATALATVLVYWADPTVGFAKPKFFGMATVAAPPMRNANAPGFVSARMSGTIPATAPGHICLLACVTHSLDKAGTIIDVIKDRHWAQRNLFTASSSLHPAMVPFDVANPFAEPQAFVLRVRPLEFREVERLALGMGLEPSDNRPRLRLADGLGHPLTDTGFEVATELKLDAFLRRRFTLQLDLGQALAPHRVAAVECLLFRADQQDVPVGSLGVALVGDTPDG